MELIGRKIVLIFLISCPWLISSISLDSLYLNFIHRNLSDFASFNRFYQGFLRDARQHRMIDTVSSPIDLEKIRSNHYTEDYLKNSVKLFSQRKSFQLQTRSLSSAMKQHLICSLLMVITQSIWIYLRMICKHFFQPFSTQWIIRDVNDNYHISNNIHFSMVKR